MFRFWRRLIWQSGSLQRLGQQPVDLPQALLHSLEPALNPRDELVGEVRIEPQQPLHTLAGKLENLEIALGDHRVVVGDGREHRYFGDQAARTVSLAGEPVVLSQPPCRAGDDQEGARTLVSGKDQGLVGGQNETGIDGSNRVQGGRVPTIKGRQTGQQLDTAILQHAQNLAKSTY
jgi:hypothetical protein